MKEKVELSPCEILHIIGTLGKDDFFGIEDGFVDMDEIEIKVAISKAENTLIEKGYAELDFNGNFSVAEEINEILLLCADCDRYLDVQITNVNGSDIKKSIYRKNNKFVSLEEVNSEYYLICYTNIQTIKDEILSNINWINEKSKILKKILFAQKFLTGAKSTVGFGSEEMLFKECNNKNIAKVISNGLNGNSNYYVITLFTFSNDNMKMDGLLVLNSADGSLEMETENEEVSDEIIFKPTDFETVRTKITDTIDKFEREVEFN